MSRISFLDFGIFFRKFEHRCKVAIRKFIFSSQWQTFEESCSKNPLTEKLKTDFPKFGQKVLRPYLSSQYRCLDRVQILLEHYSFLEKRGLSELTLKSTAHPLSLASFLCKSGHEFEITLQSDVENSLEGEFTLTIHNSVRSLYQVCFTFCRIEGVPAIHVGSIQGPNGINRVELVRQATRELFGARPRDFLFQALTQIGDLVGCRKIYLVSNENRICSIKKYDRKGQVFADYDQIWKDQRAKLNPLGFYELQCETRAVDLTKIPSKRRSERKKREDLLRNISEQIKDNFYNIIGKPDAHPPSDALYGSVEIFEIEPVWVEARGF